jgi:hypothetical protein
MYDQMSNGGESDNVYVEHLSFYLNEPTAHATTFGSQRGNQVTRRWQATSLRWFARSREVVSGALLASWEANARPGELLRYRLGSPTYTYQPGGVNFPAWRSFAGFADANPEHLAER